MSPEKPNSLEELLNRAGQTVQPTHEGWKTLPQRLARVTQMKGRRWWLWAPVPVAAAAAVLLFFAFGPKGLFSPNPAQGQESPIRVERQDVELTVLSVAETEGETLYMPLVEKLGKYFMPNAGLSGAAVSNVNPGLAMRKGRGYYQPQPVMKRTGQALVKDHRLVFNLKEGDNILKFTDVAATIDPTSVRLVSDRDGTEVKEQNFEYDLASADMLLKRYIDRKIVCISKDGQETDGYLASFDETGIVLTAEPPVPPGRDHPGSPEKKTRTTQSLTREDLQAIRLEEMPAGLLVKPTLVWKVHAKAAGKHDMTLTYLCGYIKWNADYVAVVDPSEGLQPDFLNITGWVTLDNSSGASYEKAGLKLIAGDVNRKRDPWAIPDPPPPNAWGGMGWGAPANALDDGTDKQKKEFVEKSFFEYHLYTLTAPSTVRDKQIKQLSLLKKEKVKASRRYVYDPQLDQRRLAIELVAKNETENNLGIPLPKGRVIFEQKDSDGENALIGQTDIDHTAVKEELSLKYGYAFDVAGEFKQLAYQQFNPRHYAATYEIRVRNHKTAEVQVRAIARLGTNWKITKSTMAHEEHDFQTVYFNFPLKANAEHVITYTVDYEY